MVKIRLQRLGNKGRPYYRVVVARSSAGRDGSFVEVLGTYNPIKVGKPLDLNNDRALHWLMEGAVPSESAANLLKRSGVLDSFFAERPSHRSKFKFLDKRVAATASTTIETPIAVAEPPAVVEAQAPAEADAETASATEPSVES